MPVSHGGTIFVVDDEKGVRQSLAHLLEASGYRVATFDSSQSFLDHYEHQAPACAIVDLQLPQIDGLELQRRLMALDASLPVIFITGFGNVPSSVQAMKAGAIDYIEKPYDATEIVAAVRFALEVSEHRSAHPYANPTLAVRLAELTPRELDVYRLLIGQLANKEIARELGLSPRTVEIHRGNLMRKLGARSMLHLGQIATELGIEPATKRPR
jgi:two-component system response regulator FixJ